MLSQNHKRPARAILSHETSRRYAAEASWCDTMCGAGAGAASRLMQTEHRGGYAPTVLRMLHPGLKGTCDAEKGGGRLMQPLSPKAWPPSNRPGSHSVLVHHVMHG